MKSDFSLHYPDSFMSGSKEWFVIKYESEFFGIIKNVWFYL